MGIDLKGNPFYLSESDIQWVKDTLAGMTQDEKIQQLFFPALMDFREESINEMMSKLHPSGFMFRVCSAEEAIQTAKLVNSKSKIPMLIAANLEKGGNGIVSEGTVLGAPMEIAATENAVENAARLGTVCAREGKAVGCNWSFAPIIDINTNFRNPITNTRTFGSDPKLVAACGKAYTEACQKLGMAVSIKHFPGDGQDERDQHLVTTVNHLGCDEWMDTYGTAYKASIDAGALTVMVGHIMQPAWQKKLNPELRDEDILPGSLSPELVGENGLLRGVLGFNGLIVTDASAMAGFTIAMERSKAVPRAIASGADIFLFNRNLDEDMEAMRAGVEDGTITKERLDEAVTRILALKAALKLHEPAKELKTEDAMKVLHCPEHVQWAQKIAQKSITLVKEEKGVLPLDPAKKRVLYCPIETVGGAGYSAQAGACAEFKTLLEKEGFEVTEFVPPTKLEGGQPRSDSFKKNYDYIIYLANLGTRSNQTTVRIEWQQPMGANCPHYLTSVPTIFISVENPYHLLDAPRVRTYINTYSSDRVVLHELVEKLMGRDSFQGKSPVDAFCGMWDARL